MEQNTNSCSGCEFEYAKNAPWYSVRPHPCSNCTRRSVPYDNYTPKKTLTKVNE